MSSEWVQICWWRYQIHSFFWVHCIWGPGVPRFGGDLGDAEVKCYFPAWREDNILKSSEILGFGYPWDSQSNCFNFDKIGSAIERKKTVECVFIPPFYGSKHESTLICFFPQLWLQLSLSSLPFSFFSFLPSRETSSPSTFLSPWPGKKVKPPKTGVKKTKKTVKKHSECWVSANLLVEIPDSFIFLSPLHLGPRGSPVWRGPGVYIFIYLFIYWDSLASKYDRFQFKRWEFRSCPLLIRLSRSRTNTPEIHQSSLDHPCSCQWCPHKCQKVPQVGRFSQLTQNAKVKDFVETCQSFQLHYRDSSDKFLCPHWRSSKSSNKMCNSSMSK